MSVSNPSRLESVRDILIGEFQGITVANGFRQDIVKVDGSYVDPRDVKAFPMIQLYLGDLRVEKVSQDWSIVNINANVYAVGVVKGTSSKLSTNPEISTLQNEVYKMQSDLLAKTSELATAYSGTSANPFVLDLNANPVRIFAVPDFKELDRVAVYCTFGIKMRSVDFATVA